jgi:hypothetical protein
VRFTDKRGDISDAEQSNAEYLRSFKIGDTTVRFLEEMSDWERYREHYTVDGKMFPCIKSQGECPGCNSDNEKVSKNSRKYATNVYLVDSSRVLPFKIPISLAKKMEARADKNGGTITNRDYVVMRTGKTMMDTEYDVDTDEKYAIDTAEKLKEGADINALLEAAFREQWGDPEDYVEGAAPRTVKPQGDPDEDRPEWAAKDEEIEALKAKIKAREAAKEEHVDLPTEASVQSASADDEVIDEEDLYKMSRNDLETVAMKVGVSFDGMTDRQLIRKIIASA